MHAAQKAGIGILGVKEIDPQHGKPCFALEREQALEGKDGGPISEHAPTNIHLLEEVCYTDWERVSALPGPILVPTAPYLALSVAAV